MLMAANIVENYIKLVNQLRGNFCQNGALNHVHVNVGKMKGELLAPTILNRFFFSFFIPKLSCINKQIKRTKRKYI